jgi:hypothetical protein
VRPPARERRSTNARAGASPGKPVLLNGRVHGRFSGINKTSIGLRGRPVGWLIDCPIYDQMFFDI